jgi:hypothetical protein
MSTEIARFYSGAVITACSSAASTTPRIPYGRYSGGGVIIANTNGATQINWYASNGPEDVPAPIYVSGAAVTTAVTVGAHPIPDACFGFPYLAPIISGATACGMTVPMKG